MSTSLVSIVIVNWNSSELLKNCLKSIRKTERPEDYEVIVIDNASSDDSVEMVKRDYPGVLLVENKYNLGFARATNIGIKLSKGDIILLLNSDAELKTPNTLPKVREFFSQHQQIGILGVNLVFPDGVPQSPGGKFISNWQLFKYQVLFLSSPLFYKIKNKFYPMNARQFYDIDYVSGACFFVKREVIDDIGLLNENFYMYGEDMEFCYRAKKKGWQSVILPAIEAVHLKGQSTKKDVEKILFHSIKNNCFLIKKIYGLKKAVVAHFIYTLGLFFRLILAFARKNQKPGVYWKLMIKNIKLCFSG